MMPADKGIKELEDELAALMKQAKGELDDEEVVEPEVKAPDLTDDDAFVPAPPKREKPAEPEGEEATWKKRHGDLRRHTQKIEKELKDQLTAAQSKIDELKNRTSTPPTNPDEVKAWVEKFPQVAAIIKSLAEEQAHQLYGGDIQQIKRETANAQKSRELARIYKAHEDFDEIKSDDAFHDWVESRSRLIQNAVYNGSADEVIEVLDLYKEFRKPKANPEKKAAEGVKPSKTQVSTTDGKRKYLESEIEDMTPVEFEKHSAEINEAIREGRFVYDITGAAR